MKYTIDVAYKSLFKHGEELCGDKVAVARAPGTTICVLALAMGEGYLVDISLIYTMLGFLAVVLLTKVYMGVYLERKQKEAEKGAKTDA